MANSCTINSCVIRSCVIRSCVIRSCVIGSCTIYSSTVDPCTFEPCMANPRASTPIGRRRAPLRLLLAMAVAAALGFSAADASAYRRHGRGMPRPRDVVVTQRSAEDPLQIVVSIGSQRLFVYDRLGLLESSTISTGVGGYPTPTGVFTVLDKEWQHYSNLYGAAPMPFMQRLTMSGVALHSGMVTGRPASHGCIRLPHAFAVSLYRQTRLGARVVIATNDPAPAEIVHARLFVHKSPPVAPADAQGRDPDTPLAIAIAGAAALDKGSVDARLGKITSERWRTLEGMPISVFVSAEEGKVFVRHGFRPLFDAPIDIAAPQRRLGTHVFTALEYKDATRTEMRWQVLSLPPESARADRAFSRIATAERGSSAAISGVAQGPPATAAEALERIAMPPEAVDRIAELLSPGASLIISDHGFNREMRANGTDFIVLTHASP
jgi:L,D-transpeptidase catalytic domain